MSRILLSISIVAGLVAHASVYAHEGHSHHAGHGGHAAHATAASAATQPLDGVVVRDCWVRTMPVSLPSAGYFVVHNQSPDAVKLVGLKVEEFAHTMLHETVNEDGMSRMQHTDEVEVAPGATLHFKPGGYHAMLEEPTAKLVVGNEVDVRFLFAGDRHVDTRCLLQAPASLERSHGN